MFDGQFHVFVVGEERAKIAEFSSTTVNPDRGAMETTSYKSQK